MKYNFIVSDYRKLWIEGATCLYIVEPYVYYRLERTGHISDYDDIIVAPYRRQSSSDLEKDHNFVQLKFDKYVKILAERLNQIHGTSYSIPFWRRALSISFERYITYFHEVFENCELYFKKDRHDCNVLSEKSYYVPLDFEEQRNFFQHSNYGQEQIFSLYMHTFYPGGLKTKDDQYKTHLESGQKSLESPKKSIFLRLLEQGFSRTTFNKILLRLKHEFSRATFNNRKQKIFKMYYSRKAHKIGILGSFFSTENLDLLIIKSRGLIYPLEWQINLIDSDNYSPLWDDRELLTENRIDFDKFDRFFFASLKHCLPRIFIENFKKVENYYINYFKTYNDLKYVTSEAWLSSSSLSIALALLKERGVKHIYNEHNYFEHPWVGSLIPKEASLSDIFVSMGWYNNKINNIVQGASLREFKLDDKPEKRYKICYIGSSATAKRPNYTASYGWSCENAPKHFKFVRLFLEGLSYQTRCDILYKGYPVSNFDDWLAYDPDYRLDPYFKDIQKHNDINIPGKLIMLQSNLVIVDYLSTSYLEAMIMNIPTIFFWNPEAYYLSNDYSDFFDSLISVGICQTDPIKAANFVESVKDDPGKWWFSEEVQKGRNEFLNRNFGKPEAMITYLLGLLK